MKFINLAIAITIGFSLASNPLSGATSVALIMKLLNGRIL